MSRPEKALEDALSAFKSGQYSSIRATAKAFNVPPSTLKDRINGRENKRSSHRKQQRLTPAQEKLLVKFCRVLEWIPTHATIRVWATLFLRANGDTAALGKNWIQGFIARNLEVIGYLGQPPDRRITEKEMLRQAKKGKTFYRPDALPL